MRVPIVATPNQTVDQGCLITADSRVLHRADENRRVRLHSADGEVSLDSRMCQTRTAKLDICVLIVKSVISPLEI